MTKRTPDSRPQLFTDAELTLSNELPEVATPLREAWLRHEALQDNEQSETMRQINERVAEVAEGMLEGYTRALTGAAPKAEIDELRSWHDTLEARGTSRIWTDKRRDDDQRYVERGVAKRASTFKGNRGIQNREAGLKREKLDKNIVARRTWEEFGRVFQELRFALDYGDRAKRAG